MLQSELYQQIFKNANQPPIYLMDELIQKYPWFSAAHYFRLYHQHNHTGISARMAALHFNNPLLLKLRLNQTNLTYQPPIPPVEEIPKQTVDELPKQAVDEIIEIPKSVEPNLPQDIKITPEEIKVENIVKPEVPTATKEESLLFEPLYTTDYFASQGIKLSEEAKTNDKLGKQLKSFTEWLKTMKKLPATAATNIEDVTIDPAVPEIAEKSNKELEIYTESLAEVYVSQGKVDKANEIYRKLILLNPHKSAYFAAKIDQFKD